MNLAFTICSANYLPFAKSLGDSLIQHNPNYQFVIALADTYTDYDADFFRPHQIIPVTNMNIPHFEELNERYNIFELSCALKPLVANFFLQNDAACKNVFYFDSDMLLFGTLSKAEAILEEHEVVLTPHLTKASAYEEHDFTELNILRTGLYNAGFFGINSTHESRRFLYWWQERLRYHCFNNAMEGLFVDQLWLNLAVLYFKNIFVLKDPGYNVAYWNFPERKVTFCEGGYLVNGSYPLVLFHYSGYDVFRPEIISKHVNNIPLQDVAEYIPFFDLYRQKVLSSNIRELLSLPSTLGKLPPPEEPKTVVTPKPWFRSLFNLKR